MEIWHQMDETWKWWNIFYLKTCVRYSHSTNWIYTNGKTIVSIFVVYMKLKRPISSGSTGSLQLA